MVRVDKDYAFTGPDGSVSLLDLFEGAAQLIVYHAMYGPDWDAACPGCTAVMDESSPGLIAQLRARDTNLVRVSRAPYAKLAACREAHGWTFAWVSSYGSEFNYDFHVTLDERVAPIEINFRSSDELAARYPDWRPGSTPDEISGVSCFLRDGTQIFHTYSTYGRGTEDPALHAYHLLDLTALGRQEDWETPPGRALRLRGADSTFRA
jgi:predicted dithiol-disulfide oxidoreductase (DUF899 family)